MQASVSEVDLDVSPGNQSTEVSSVGTLLSQVCAVCTLSECLEMLNTRVKCASQKLSHHEFVVEQFEPSHILIA
jgi:hypothetical protein